MSLPLLNSIQNEITLPISKKTIKIRPYLVGEEKSLLIAYETKEEKAIVDAVKNLIKSCILEGDVRVETLSMIDIEYIFLELRKLSVDQIVEIKISHKDNEECDHFQKVKIDLNKVELTGTLERKIILDEDKKIGVLMKAPSLDIAENLKSKSVVEQGFEMLRSCILAVFTEKEVMKLSDFSKEEIDKWINNLNKQQLEKIYSFFNNMPYLKYDLEYTCDKCGKIEKRELRGLQSFLS